MTTKVVKGTIWTLSGLSIPIFFSLFATPIVTRLLGAEGYGLFILILLIPAYLSFADFGMNIASTKFGSAAFAEGSPEKEAKIVRTAALIALLSSLPFAAAMAIFSPTIARVANVPPDRMIEASFALKLAAIVFVINFLNFVFNTPQLTRLRMDLNILVFSGVRIIGIIATPIVVYYGGGVTGAVGVALAVSIITLAGHIIVSSRLLPELIGFSIDRASVRPLLKFGGSLVVAGIAAVLLHHLEKFVLTKATSVETLGYYSIAATFAAMLTLLSGSIVQSLMPAFSQLQSREDGPALNALFSRGIRLTLVWLIPAVTFMVLVGWPFFTYWFSADFGRESTGPYYIIIAGLFLNVLAYFPYAALMAAGRSEIFAKLYWIELVPYILLVWWLASSFGAKGAAAAWSIRVIIDAIVLFYLGNRVANVSYRQANIGYSLLAAFLMSLPIIGLIYFGTLNLPIIITAFVCAAAYALICLKKILHADEVRWFLAKVLKRDAG